MLDIVVSHSFSVFSKRTGMLHFIFQELFYRSHHFSLILDYKNLHKVKKTKLLKIVSYISFMLKVKE
jgi:hypothetical protein